MGGGGQSGGVGSYYPTEGAALGAAQSQLGQSDYSWLTALGRGTQQFGSAVAQSGDHTNYMTGAPQYPQQQNTGLNVGERPQSIALDQRVFDEKKQKDLIEALKRLFASKQKEDVKIPDTGAAPYWYVDPRAQAFGQDAGMLPEGTQPGF